MLILDPVAEILKLLKRRVILIEQQFQCHREVAAVRDQVPVTSEDLHFVNLVEADQAIAENLKRRRFTVDHLPLRVMANDGRSLQPFQKADLDFLRPEFSESIKAAGETCQIFPRESDDQIGMNVDAGVISKEVKVIFQYCIVLLPTDQMPDVFVKGLNTDFELKNSGWKHTNQIAQRIRKTIRDHFKMKEESLSKVIEKELKDRLADSEIQIERSVDKLELSSTAIQ